MWRGSNRPHPGPLYPVEREEGPYGKGSSTGRMESLVTLRGTYMLTKAFAVAQTTF
jgi:hypothetical protein